MKLVFGGRRRAALFMMPAKALETPLTCNSSVLVVARSDNAIIWGDFVPSIKFNADQMLA